MKCQILFSGKNKKYFKMLSAGNFTQHALADDILPKKLVLLKIGLGEHVLYGMSNLLITEKEELFCIYSTYLDFLYHSCTKI